MSDKITIVANKTNVILTTISCILIVGLFVVGYFVWNNLKKENALLQSQVTEFYILTESFARSSTEWVTKKDLEKGLKGLLTKDELDLLKEDMKKLDSELFAIGKATGRVEQKIKKLEKSTSTIPNTDLGEIQECPSGGLIDKHEYTKNIQIKEIEDNNSAPIAEVQFDASKEAPWNYTVHEKNFNVSTIVGKRDSGQLTFHHKLTYSIPEKTGDKEYPIQIVSSDYKQLHLKNKMFWLNPILDISAFAGGTISQFAPGPGRRSIFSAGADFGISLSSYGETKADSLLRLFRFGIGYNIERQAGHLSFAPLTFNIGKPLPLITNLYMMPMLAIDTAGGLTLNFGIGLQL